MLLKGRVKAGVMLYALLLTAIFAQLLQFYLNQVLASQKQYQALLNNSKAYMMAILTNEHHQKVGEQRFSEGKVTYHTQGEKRLMTVILNNQEVYHYQFLSQEEKEFRQFSPAQKLKAVEQTREVGLVSEKQTDRGSSN